MCSLYSGNAVKIWNGTSFNGAQEITNLCAQLPVSQHKVESLDAHPITFPKGYSGLLITVTGSLRFGLRPEKKFIQNFVIQQDLSRADQQYYQIISDIFRSGE
eukprot:TRINITY_DN283_c0_g1_i1.p1 TRINITY_DN283_c0_g1~~TRINITY_DN283_c0_g1_i1.p1  ORF type:complete len:103 (+),score=29.40 TRINITY_DN283_c0_g1_i1:377-685(+)